jgi:hypothetical protein
MRDLDGVVDVAQADIAKTKGNNPQVAMLVRLAEALLRAGATARAREALVKAGPMLDPPHDFMSSLVRGNVIRKLAKLGDDSAAEALTNVDATLPIKVHLLGELGNGRAQSGNTRGALENARAIASLGSLSDPVFAEASERALKTIGIALVEAGAVDDALHIADGMPHNAAALQIVARAATKLCKESKNDKGRDLAERTARDAGAVAVPADKPFLMFEPILNAAEAITACNGLAAAADFVRGAIPPQTKDITRSALINQLAGGQLDLALAVASSPKPDDAQGFIDQARRLKRRGDIAAATTAALEASRIIVSRKNIYAGGVIVLLAELGAYDAAIATTEARPLNRNEQYVEIVGAAVDRKDTEDVARLTAMTIKALNEPQTNGVVQTPLLENLVRKLANGGYRNEARPIVERLSALSQDIFVAPASRVSSARLAVAQVLVGDLPGALKSVNDTGAMVEAPDRLMLLAVVTMHFAGAREPPTPEQINAAMERAKATLPKQIAGPKARSLSDVARELAAQRDIMGALQVVAYLDVEPRDVLAPPRDGALSWIADAQVRTGDLRGALATTLKITNDNSRFERLLKLAASRPTS